MFFENDNFNIEILSVFYIDRNKKSDFSSRRVHHALSYRIIGDAIFTENNESFEAKDGDLVIVPPTSDYRLTNGKEKLFVIHFLCDKKIADRIKKFSPTDCEYVHDIFQKMHTAYCEKKPGYKHECRSLFYKLIYTVENELALSHKPNKYLTLALEYIGKHFTEPAFSSEQTAKSLNISTVYLRKLFSKYMGLSVKEYIDKLRVERALELLGSGYYTVSKSAEKCGFSDVYYFSAFIKKHTGRSPKHHLG